MLMDSCELTFSITAAAQAIARNLSDDDLNLAGAVFTQLGDTLITIATQRAICEKKANDSAAAGSSSQASADPPVSAASQASEG